MTPETTKRVEAFAIDLGPSPGGEAFAQYCANSAPLCAIELPPGGDAAAFWFRSTLYQLPDALLFRASAAAHRMRRGPAEIAQGADQIMLAVQLEGEVVGDFDGQRSVHAGDVYLIDQLRPYDSHVTAFEMIALFLARDRFAEHVLTPQAHGAVLPARSGGGRLIGRTMETLFDAAGDLTPVELNAAIEGLCATAAGLFAAVLQPTRSGGFARAASFIDRRLADPGLQPSDLERELGFSRSSLYRLFAPYGGVATFISNRRLDRAARLLLDQGRGRLTVRALAEQCGFGNEDHIGRAFRARFGVPPRVFQHMVQRRDKDAMQKQASAAGFDSLEAWIRNLGDA